MTERQATIPEDRPLTAQEVEFLRWLLDHGEPEAARYLTEIDSLRVVSRCGCGCATIDFVEVGSALDTLSEHQWRDVRGRVFGAVAYAARGKLAGIEVWSMDGLATPSYLPHPFWLTLNRFGCLRSIVMSIALSALLMLLMRSCSAGAIL